MCEKGFNLISECWQRGEMGKYAHTDQRCQSIQVFQWTPYRTLASCSPFNLCLRDYQSNHLNAAVFVILNVTGVHFQQLSVISNRHIYHAFTCSV